MTTVLLAQNGTTNVSLSWVRILRPGLLLPGSIPGRVGLPRLVPGCSPKPTGSCTRVVSHWPITGRSRAAGPTDQPERSQRGFLLGRLQAWYCPSPYHDILGHDFLFKEHDILTSLSERVRNYFWPNLFYSSDRSSLLQCNFIKYWLNVHVNTLASLDFTLVSQSVTVLNLRHSSLYIY